MNKQEVITKVKELFSFPTTEETKEELMDITTIDGVVITIDETTGMAMIEGEVAPNGEYTLVDETIITITDGMIEVVEEEVTEEVEVETMEVVEDEAETKCKDCVELSTRVETLESAITELKTLLETKTTEMNSQIEKFGATPAVEEVKINKTINTPKVNLDTLMRYANVRNSK